MPPPDPPEPPDPPLPPDPGEPLGAPEVVVFVEVLVTCEVAAECTAFEIFGMNTAARPAHKAIAMTTASTLTVPDPSIGRALMAPTATRGAPMLRAVIV